MVALAQIREPRTPLRVLVVEDSEDDALLLWRELRRGGYEPDWERVETPDAMREALASSSSSWDVILSDYNLPRFSAPEALVMAREVCPEVPFIVVSGKVGEELAVEAMKAGAHDYVMKENLARLCATLERGLEEARERRKRRRAERDLRRRDAILEAVRFAAERLLGEAVGWEESVKAVLRRLGEATGAGRVYVFENFVGEDGELWASQRYEWVTQGVTAQMDNPLMQALPYKAAGFGRWIRLLGRGEPVYGHTRELPESEQPELREQDILSIVVVPIFVEGRWWGFVGFDECSEEREWSPAEVSALGAAAGTLGAAIRRKQIEEELRGSEERYRAVVEDATDGIYLLDAGDRRILETNPSFQKMLGYTAGELRGMEVYDFVAHPREDVESTIRCTLEERRRIVGGREYRRKDGSIVEVEVGVSVIQHDGREVICTIVRDVTERKEAEERLRASEAELRALFEAMTDLIFVLDGEGLHLKVAPTNPSILYRTPTEIVGKTLHEIFPAEQADEFLGYVRHALETRQRINFEYSLLVDHRQMWFEGTVAPMLEDSVVWIARDITERKRAEEALAGSENRLRTIIETEPECVKVLGMDASLLEMNPAGLSMIEADSLEQVRGKSVYEYIAPEHRTAFVALTERVLHGGSGTLEFKLIGLKGTSRWLETHAVPLRDAGGEIAGLLAITRNITARKRNEAALRESEERFKGLAEATFEGVAITRDGEVVETNAAFAEMFGYEPSEVIGMTPLEFTAPESRETVRRARASGLEEPYESVSLKKDGTTFDTEIRGKWSLYKGEPVRVTAIRDITERKKNEEALRQSERLYRAVMEQATENIYLVDAETRRIVESNPVFRESLGYSEKELHNLTLYDIVAADPETIDANIRRVVEEETPFVGVRKYRRKDGSIMDVEVSASTILRHGRETLCAVAHDVTERVRAQELLEERLATLSRIAAGLTLDLAVENTLDVLTESVVNASTAVACLVNLTDEKTGALHPAGSHGMPEGYTAGLRAAYRAGVKSPTLEAFRTRRPVLVRDLRRIVLGDPLYAPIHHLVLEVPWNILYIVPLISRGRAVGAINLCYPPDREPGEDERAFLRAVADQTATAVENARLYSEARGKAALEERQRLARELHDSVSQALYGIALGTKTARALLAQDPARVADPLDYVLSLADAGMAEMRALIFELRPESLETEGLVAALEKQAAALRARHEIEVEATLCDEPETTLEAKETVYRIAQEALHNIVKHAHARKVEIHMECHPDHVTLDIADDGVGFDAQGEFPGHLGLRSMRERAWRMGGTLRVQTAPGSGTRLGAHIPL